MEPSSLFSSLPPSVDVLCSASELEAVKMLLFECRGQWLRADVIASKLGWQRSRTAERVRRSVKELQMVGVPIVSGHAGFSWATSQVMVDACLAQERLRLQGLLRSVEALSRIRVDEGQEVVLSWCH